MPFGLANKPGSQSVIIWWNFCSLNTDQYNNSSSSSSSSNRSSNSSSNGSSNSSGGSSNRSNSGRGGWSTYLDSVWGHLCETTKDAHEELEEDQKGNRTE